MKWIVSSTAIPKQMLNTMTLVICSGRPVTPRNAAVTAIGNKFGTMLISPSRKLRKPTAMTTKMITAAEPRLAARSEIIWFKFRAAMTPVPVN